MGRHLAGDRNAPRLRVPEEPHGGGGRHVGDVDRGAGEIGEGDVARDHDLLGRRRDPPEPEVRRHEALVHHAALAERGVLGVRDDRATERLRVLERPAEEGRVHHRPPVVGVRDAAGLGQLPELRQLPPREPARHRADGVHAHDAPGPRLREDVVRHGAGVVDRLRVGHARDRGEPARRRRPGAARDRLLVLLPRLPEVDVDVDESGGDHPPPGVDRLGARRRVEPRPHPGHQARLDQDVPGRVQRCSPDRRRGRSG